MPNHNFQSSKQRHHQGKNTEIIPGILTNSPKEVYRQVLNLLQLEPQPKTIQLDVIDGEFAPNLTVEPSLLHHSDLQDLFKKNGMQVDLHLMTIDPIDYAHEVYGLDNIRYIIGQIERMHNQEQFIDEVLANHFKPGFSLDLYTPFDSIDRQLLPQLNAIQIMGGKAGEQGQEFNQKVLAKIEEVTAYRDELNLEELEIMVDIGMNPDTVALAMAAGADGLVVGSFLATAQDTDQQQERWEELLSAIE